jgi:hypothetical protein
MHTNTYTVHAHTCTQTHTQFFSGDTCQTIALGVGFRFEDLKSLFLFEQQQQREEYRDVSVPSRFLIKIPKVQNLGNANLVCVGECALRERCLLVLNLVTSTP